MLRRLDEGGMKTGEMRKDGGQEEERIIDEITQRETDRGGGRRLR